MILPIIDLYQFVIENKTKSVHEIIGNPINKMYFDIEKTFTLDQLKALKLGQSVYEQQYACDKEYDQLDLEFTNLMDNDIKT